QPRQRARPRAGREHDMLRREIGDGLTVLRDTELAAALECGVAVEDRDLVLLHEKADAVRELLRYLARALHDLLHVEADLLRGEAVVAEMMQEVIDLRGPQQRLRGNAAPVEADAA